VPGGQAAEVGEGPAPSGEPTGGSAKGTGVEPTGPETPVTDESATATDDATNAQNERTTIEICSDDFGRPPTTCENEGSPRFPENESQTKHIFGDREGHLPDTPANRALLRATASNPQNFLGTDRFGNQWFAELNGDGTQIWVRVRGGVINNGGLNQVPRTFNPESGLSAPGRM
jgi:filamentous hemagglutinin